MTTCTTSNRVNGTARQGYWSGQMMLAVFTVLHAVLSSAVAQSGVDPPQAKAGQIVGKGVVESAFVLHVAAPFKAVLLEVRADGESVRKGEVVAELDTSELQDQMQIQEIEVAIAKQMAEQVKNTLNRLKKQRVLQEQHRALSEKTVELEKDFVTARNGGFATRLKQLAIKKRANDLSLDHAKRRHAQLLEQQKSNGVSDDAVAESNVAVVRAEAKVETVALELQFLKKKQALKLHRLEVESSRNNLSIMAAIHNLRERTQNLERDLKTHEANAAQESDKLKRIKKQIQSAVVVAKTNGVVRCSDWRGDPIDVGDIMKERQRILSICDEEHLQVRVHVDESVVSAIRKGQQVKMMHLSKANSSVYHGTIAKIGTLRLRRPAEAGFDRDSRIYRVVVTLPNPSTLKIGEHLVAEFQSD